MEKSVLIAGGTGLIGSHLSELFISNGYTVHILSRKQRSDTEHIKYHQWSLTDMTIDEEATNVPHIINLTGAGVVDSRWTDKRKKVLIDSRVNAALLLLQNIKEHNHKLKTYVSASAVGYYGDRGSEVLTEDSDPGEGFLTDCCIAWEEAAQKLTSHVERLVINRVGIVLSKKGGALPKILMTRPVLSYFGDGSQYFPWIHIDDICNIFYESVVNQNMQGIYNAVSPDSITNKNMIKQIRKVLGGIVMPAPAFGLKLAMGEMATAILGSNNVLPQRLIEIGHQWKFTTVDKAVKDIMDRKI